MSRGLGQIQRTVRDYFRRRPYAAITAEALCRRIRWSLDKPTRSQIVAVLRAGKRLAEVYPIGFMVSKRHGNPLVFYRTDNEISRHRAELLCRPNCRETVLSELPDRPKEPTSTRSEWHRPTALPGAVAAAYKYLLQHGKEPTAEAITEFLKGTFSFAEIAMALMELQRNGHLSDEG